MIVLLKALAESGGSRQRSKRWQLRSRRAPLPVTARLGGWVLNCGGLQVPTLGKPPYGGFHINGRPLYCWMVFVRKNPIYQWMMTGGSPILGHLHVLLAIARCPQVESSRGSSAWLVCKGAESGLEVAPSFSSPSQWTRDSHLSLCISLQALERHVKGYDK